MCIRSGADGTDWCGFWKCRRRVYHPMPKSPLVLHVGFHANRPEQSSWHLSLFLEPCFLLWPRSNACCLNHSTTSPMSVRLMSKVGNGGGATCEHIDDVPQAAQAGEQWSRGQRTRRFFWEIITRRRMGAQRMPTCFVYSNELSRDSRRGERWRKRRMQLQCRLMCMID